jgi:thiol:disulfide interchange protein DsbC
MRKFNQILAISAISLLSSTQAISNTYTDEQMDSIREFGKDAQTVNALPLPMKSVFFAERGNQFVIISDNGRYEFKGYFRDRWMNEDIHTYDDALYSSQHLPFEQVTNLNVNDLKPMIYGSGPERVIAFVRPQEPASHQFLDSIKELGKDFTFHLIPLPPASGNPRITLSYTCPKNTSRALSVLMHNTSYELLEHLPSCDRQVMMNRLLTHHVFGFFETPSVIAPSTRIQQGDHNNWVEFLANNKSR